MTNVIVKLVLHILCVIAWVACSSVTNDKKSSVLYTICSVLWAICVGIDIVKLSMIV